MKNKLWLAVGAVLVMSGLLTGTAYAQQGSGQGKVVICHVPPGNPANAHTIRVGQSALPAHLAHGDYQGPCQATSSSTSAVQTEVQTEIAWVEVTGVVVRYDAQLGVILLDDDTVVMLSSAPNFAIQIGMTLWVQGQEVDERHLLADRISTQPFVDDFEEDDVPPILIDLTGTVEQFDALTGVLILDRVITVLVTQPEFEIQVGMVVNVSGALLEDGRLLVDVIERADFATPAGFVADAAGRATICHVPPGNAGNAHTITIGASAVPAHMAHGDYLGPCTAENTPAGVQIVAVDCPDGCDPLLITLADHLSVSYTDLVAWHAKGYSVGVIARAYLVAQAAGVTVDEVFTRHDAGETWGQIVKSYRSVKGMDQPASVGNGRGQSIREKHGGGKFGNKKHFGGRFGPKKRGGGRFGNKPHGGGKKK